MEYSKLPKKPSFKIKIGFVLLSLFLMMTIGFGFLLLGAALFPESGLAFLLIMSAGLWLGIIIISLLAKKLGLEWDWGDPS